MTCVCVIPARGGSRRIPRKNIKEFHGKPIIAYSIEAAKESGVFDGVYVSTEDQEIAEISSQFGAKIVWRSPALAMNEVGTQDVMKQALLDIDDYIDFACCLYATAPMVSIEELRYAYEIISDGSTDYVVPVATWLRDPGQFYFGTAEAFMRGVDLIGECTVLIKSSPFRECDINTMSDWIQAEDMYDAMRRTQ